MRAVVQDRYGAEPEDVLRVAEIGRPTIGDDEVMVRVQAASVDLGTWHLMAGLPYLGGHRAGQQVPHPVARLPSDHRRRRSSSLTVT